MEKLQLPHAKLFYFSAELFKNSKITENEKLKMKEMVINDEPQIFELLERYQANGNEPEFVNGLFGLLRPHQKQLFQPQPTQQQEELQAAKKRVYEPEAPPQPQPVRQQQQVQQQQPQNNAHLVPQQVEFQEQNQEVINPLNNDQIAQFIEKHPDCPDEISSPLGLKLLKRKQKTQKANPQIKDYLKPYKIDQE